MIDQTAKLLLKGYGWLPDLRRRTGDGVVHTRLLGQPTVALCGPDAARFFYQEEQIVRATAIPEFLKGTVFGDAGVQTLDGREHHHRKAMFTSILAPEHVPALVDHVTAAWDASVASWPGREPVVLFDEAGRVLTRAACTWAGVPLDPSDIDGAARDLVAMVDGFGSVGRRHRRARQARKRREAWLIRLVEGVRRGADVPAGTAMDMIPRHHDPHGEPLPARVAAVELLNVVRPIVAVSWFVTFAAHALGRWPEHKDTLRKGDPAFSEAFAHEVRRFYPLAPFVAGRATTRLAWEGHDIPSGALVLLGLYDQNHDAGLWQNPYSFDPERFVNRRLGPYGLVPQGAGDQHTGHRCPGEDITVAILRVLTERLVGLDCEMPPQDLRIPLTSVPTRPRSGILLTSAHRAT